MALGLLGRKVGMTQVFNEAGEAIPVTVIQAGPCHVLQLRTRDRDGYEAVQVGYLDKPRRLASRAQRGQVAPLESKRSKLRAQAGVEPAVKANCEPQRYVREFRVPAGDLAVGQQLRVDLFNEVKAVDVTANTKGRGYTGAMRRWGFKGNRATHGVKKYHRGIGGTSGNTHPARTFKNKKMAGHYGNERVTTKNIQLVRVDLENNLLLIRGSVPGPAGALVSIRPTNIKR
ncbi:MAG: 50S ribosomal protein L3 [Pirellulales bacterium]|nr:50S ribosomal protein L3 [Pirellulales bacterium]